MCLQHKPTVVCCVAIHLACKWSSWESGRLLPLIDKKGKFPKSSEGKEWWWYVDKSVTYELLEELVQDFLGIIHKCPTKLKQKILTYKGDKDAPAPGSKSSSVGQSPQVNKAPPSSATGKRPDTFASPQPISTSQSSMKPPPTQASSHNPHVSAVQQQSLGMRRCKSDAHLPSMASNPAPAMSFKEYKERKEAAARQQQAEIVANQSLVEKKDHERNKYPERPRNEALSRSFHGTESSRTPVDSSSRHVMSSGDSRPSPSGLPRQHGDRKRSAADALRQAHPDGGAPVDSKRPHHGMVPNDSRALQRDSVHRSESGRSLERPIPSDGSRSHHAAAVERPPHPASSKSAYQNDLKSHSMTPEQKAAYAAQKEAAYQQQRMDHQRNKDRRYKEGLSSSQDQTDSSRHDRHRDPVSTRSPAMMKTGTLKDLAMQRKIKTEPVEPRVSPVKSLRLEPSVSSKASESKSVKQEPGVNIKTEPDWIKQQRPEYKTDILSSVVSPIRVKEEVHSSPPPANMAPPKLTVNIPPPPKSPVELEPGEIRSSTPPTPSKVPVVKLERLTPEQINAHRGAPPLSTGLTKDDHTPRSSRDESHKHHSRSKSDSQHRKNSSASSSSHKEPIPKLSLKLSVTGEVKKSEPKVGHGSGEVKKSESRIDGKKSEAKVLKEEKRSEIKNVSNEVRNSSSEPKIDPLRIKINPVVGSSSSERHYTDSVGKEKERSKDRSERKERKEKHHSDHHSHRSSSSADPATPNTGLKLTISKSRIKSPASSDEKTWKLKHHHSSRKRHHSPGKAEGGSPHSKVSRRDEIASAVFVPPQPQSNVLKSVGESLIADTNGRTDSPHVASQVSVVVKEHSSSKHKHKHKSKHHSPVPSVIVKPVLPPAPPQ